MVIRITKWDTTAVFYFISFEWQSYFFLSFWSVVVAQDKTLKCIISFWKWLEYYLVLLIYLVPNWVFIFHEVNHKWMGWSISEVPLGRVYYQRGHPINFLCLPSPQFFIKKILIIGIGPSAVSHVTSHMSGVSCHMSHVIYHISCVTCHLPPVTNANSHSHIPFPLLTPSAGTAGCCCWSWQDAKNIIKSSSL